MIRNLIFDFGQVLVRFDPDRITGAYVPDPDDRALLCEALFDRRYWDRLDDGTLTEEEILCKVTPTLPERLVAPAAQILRGWHRQLPPMPGMRELAAEAKEKYGVSLYLLSNISRQFVPHAGEFPVLRLMEGCVFSGAIGLVKPSRGIFAYLCNTYRLDPDECLFIDDNPRNIAGAEAFGLHGYLFDGDAARLRAFLQKQFRD